MTKTNKLHGADDKTIDILKDCDLSENEAYVYLSALKLGNALVKDIAKLARLNRTTTYNLLLGLRKLGLVSSYQKQGLTHFSASPPSSLKDLADERIQHQENLKHRLDALLPVINGLYRSQGRGSSVKVYEALSSVKEVYMSVYKNVPFPTQGLEFTNWGGKYDLFPSNTREEFMEYFIKNKITTKSLLVEDEMTKLWFDSDGGKTQHKIIKLLPNPGWNFFCNLELCENRFAVVTYKDQGDFQGLVIESTELSSMFRFLFESVRKSIPNRNDYM